MDELQVAINNLVNDKTFSLAALEVVKDLKTKYEMTLTELGNIKSQLKEAQKLNTSLAEQASGLKTQLSDMQLRLVNITNREAKMLRLEIEKECADKIVAHTTNMFNTVFANAALKTSVMRQVANPVEGNPGGNGTYATPGFVVTSDLKEETRKEVD